MNRSSLGRVGRWPFPGRVCSGLVHAPGLPMIWTVGPRPRQGDPGAGAPSLPTGAICVPVRLPRRRRTDWVGIRTANLPPESHRLPIGLGAPSPPPITGAKRKAQPIKKRWSLCLAVALLRLLSLSLAVALYPGQGASGRSERSTATRRKTSIGNSPVGSTRSNSLRRVMLARRRAIC